MEPVKEVRSSKGRGDLIAIVLLQSRRCHQCRVSPVRTCLGSSKGEYSHILVIRLFALQPVP